MLNLRVQGTPYKMGLSKVQRLANNVSKYGEKPLQAINMSKDSALQVFHSAHKARTWLSILAATLGISGGIWAYENRHDALAAASAGVGALASIALSGSRKELEDATDVLNGDLEPENDTYQIKDEGMTGLNTT